MTKRESYPLIDFFRIIAAFLVVSIHTSPLLIFGDTPDFILTRSIARVAVPFFFMVSGFFILNEYPNSKKIKAFINRSSIIYFTAIILYIPFNIYSGYFSTENLLPKIIKDVIFNGTFYHLWYLAAAITGAFIAYLLVKKLGLKTAFVITAVLYLIGLLGDSYYGLIQNLPYFKAFFTNIFQITEYTRNGIFFAPVFFVLGAIIKSEKIKLSLKNNLIGLAISFILMLVEGLLLHFNKIQRHDSMYIMLLPCMFFLFACLTTLKGRRLTSLKSAALIIYIIHPLMIIFVRGFAKILSLQWLLIDNSLVHFLAVCITSAASAFFINKLITCLKPHKKKPDINTDRAWLEINLDNLKHNAKLLQGAMTSGCKLMAVVKAQGYGHGAAEIAKCLNGQGVNAFAVATIDEGIALRQEGVKGEILILGRTCPTRAKQLKKYDLSQTLIDYDYAVNLNSQGCKIKAHIKIDTGMHRLGFDPASYNKIKKIFSTDNLKICGIYTHLSSSQSLAQDQINFTSTQINTFYKLLDTLSLDGISLPPTHIQSSYGLLNYPHLKCDYARIGLALYGALNCQETQLQLNLRPVLALKAKVALIKQIDKSHCAGYDRKFIAKENSKIAILSIGYADGVPRCLSCNGANVLLNGTPAPIIGQICMDQLMVDITHIPNVNPGDIATIIGKDKQEEITITQFAQNAGSIPNELLSRMGTRLKLIY